MRVLVLGVDEYIGHRVAAALAGSDWAQPLADPAGIRAAGVAGVSPLACSTTDSASMARALGGVDAVVNCVSSNAATVGSTATRVFAAARKCETAPLVVHISSMSVYGAVQGEIDEDATLTGELGPYAQAKVDAEALAQGYPRRIVLRPGCEYGPGGDLWSGRIARWLTARRLGDLGAAGDGYCNLVHGDDLAAAVLLGLHRPDAIGGSFNLAAPDPPTWNDYLVRFARALGAVPVRRIGRRALALESRFLAPPLKILEIALSRVGVTGAVPEPLPPSFLRLARQEIRLDSSRARTALGWHCRPLDQGLTETAAWFVEQQRR
jgi:nucleoside-diphosphate-sugar epimerase